jgi:hypothetical protein
MGNGARMDFGYLADMILETFHTIASQYEPEFDRAEASAEGNLPMSIVNDGSYQFKNRVRKL